MLTTPDNPAEGALESVRRFLYESKIGPDLVEVVIHATTLASNAILQGKSSKTALVTTEGFRDVLEIGRQNRPELYNLQVQRLVPLVLRRYRFEIQERTSHDGRILQALNKPQAHSVARKLRKLKMESVAICFLHSYANSLHEKTVAKLIRDEVANVHISVSSELLPEFREYERVSTTVVNAVLQPLVSRYLETLKRGLRELGVRAPLFVMQSNSGTILSEQASREPARIIESGPVAGAVAARHYGRESGAGIISLDVGGTTSKAGVWTGDKFEVTTEYEVGGRLHGIRRLEGSGYPVRFPYVDLVEVGTGGGSIAAVDEAGVMRVGPESAGAFPGPACYGRGGTRPTVTDANLVLGRLSHEHLLGGELKLTPRLSKEAIEGHIARRMRTSLASAAAGILRVATANMSQALRAASIERGYDPRKMLFVAFGGAGPMHACEVAQQMEIPTVLVPPRAGLFSSLGLLLSEPMHDFVQTVLMPAGQEKFGRMESVFRAMEEKGRGLLLAEGVEEEEMVFERSLDLRYQGQAYELSVPILRTRIDARLIRGTTEAFHRMHQFRYGYSDRETPVEIVSVRAVCKSRFPTMKLHEKTGRVQTPSPKEGRRVMLNGKFVENCPVFDRQELGMEWKGRGPCVVEDYDSTLVIPTGFTYRIDRNGSFRISVPS